MDFKGLKSFRDLAGATIVIICIHLYLNYFLSIQTGKSIETKPERNTSAEGASGLWWCNPGRLIWDGDHPMPEFCLVSRGSQ